MLDGVARRMLDPGLEAAGRRLVAAGVGADAVTWAGFAIGIAAAGAIAREAYAAGLVLILVSRLCDGLDGAVARQAGKTDLGGYLDIVLDFLFYNAVVFGVALARPQDAVWAAFLIFSFVGTGTSFLAYAIIAAKRGMTSERGGRKSIFYLGGIAEGGETIAAFVLICLFPHAFPWIAGVLGALCWITTASRIGQAVLAFRD